jgi:3-methylcrotonyl-CoA carboxylase alpha subunit
MYRKILIANRGEIACRIARTLRQMDIAAATVHSTADAQSLHVQEIGESVWIGDAPARQSYLNIEAVIAAAQRVGADAVHPGFGFLSENADFARRCAEAGLTFIGPSPEVLTLFGDKSQAKQLARRLGIVTAGGLDEPSDDVDTLLRALSPLPRPCILKAVAGGGGKGMRVLREGDDARAAIEAAIREGRSAFGDGRLIAERYLGGPRHIEVQILGDGRGQVMHLWDRECSLQRRFQKVVEEAPATSISQALRERLQAQAVALGQAVNYLGLGTVEFAVSGEEAVFLEVNPRLQVEHTVTESVTGLDLVALQIRTVHDGYLPLSEAERPEPRGVAVQVRLYAEDAAQGFLPATGRVDVFDVARDVRVDAGVTAGSVISPHYDPMIAKLIAHGQTREAALQVMRGALAQTSVLGVTSNREFLQALLTDPRVRANEVNTEFIDTWLANHQAQPVLPAEVAALLAVWLVQGRRPMTDPGRSHGDALGAWQDAGLTGWRLRRVDTLPAITWQASGTAGAWRVGFGGVMNDAQQVRVDDQVFQVVVPEIDGRDSSSPWLSVNVDGRAVRLRASVSEAHISADLGARSLALDLQALRSRSMGGGDGTRDKMRAPMMGLIIAVHVKEGDMVQAGQRLATMESMKMEMTISAPVTGRVSWVGCADKDKVERHQDLFRIEAVQD